jgi:PEGA domain
MNPSKMFVATAALALCFGVASPAMAQHRDSGQHRSSGRAVARGQSHQAAPRGGAAGGSRSFSTGRAPVYRGPAISRGSAVPREGVERGSATRGFNTRGGVERGFVTRDFARRAPLRSYVAVAPQRFIRPYYMFRPRVRLSFGLWVGYPIAYSYAYFDPFYAYDPYYAPYGYASPYYAPYNYPYPYSYDPYGYDNPPAPAPGYAPPPAAYPPSGSTAPQGPIDVQPDQADMGGLSFDITPSTAQILVDGNAVGTVGEFTPSSQPLGLPAGSHHIELRAPGYQTLSFDVQIVAGQVIPYQGAMER